MLSPIAHRELLVQARSKGLYRGRIVTSIVLLCWGAIFGGIYQFGGLGAAGQMFPVFGSMLLMLSLFGGSQATADSISFEKREGTLGLLFLTPLKSADIVVGKLVSNGLPLAYIAITSFPLLSLILVAGGVQGRDLISLFAATLATLYFSTSAGLFVSSLGMDRKRVASNVSWLTLVYWMAPRALVEYMRSHAFPTWAWKSLLFFSPPFTQGPPLAPGEAIISIAGALVLGSLFLLGAWYYVPRRWQDKAERGERSWRVRWRQHWYGRPELRAAWRRKLLDEGPFYWLCARDRWKVVANVVITMLFLAGAGWIAFAAVPGGGAVVTLASCVAAITFLQKVGFATAAANQLIDEHEQGTLELILSTPLTPRDILRGQWRAIVHQNRWPYAAILAMQIFAFAMLVLFVGRPIELLVFGPLFIALHAFDLYTLGRLAPWCVTRVKVPRQAPPTSILQAVVLPGLIVGLGLGVLGFLSWQFSFRFEPRLDVCLSIYFALAIGLNLRALWIVHKYFEPALRKFASLRFQGTEEPSWWSKIFRWVRSKKSASAPSCS
jgi:ABC-type Na+ efflux pump permease subunit